MAERIAECSSYSSSALSWSYNRALAYYASSPANRHFDSAFFRYWPILPSYFHLPHRILSKRDLEDSMPPLDTCSVMNAEPPGAIQAIVNNHRVVPYLIGEIPLPKRTSTNMGCMSLHFQILLSSNQSNLYL